MFISKAMRFFQKEERHFDKLSANGVDRRPVENGFTFSRRSAEHGFTYWSRPLTRSG